MKTIITNTVHYWLDTLAADTTQARLAEEDFYGVTRTIEAAVALGDPDLWSLAMDLTMAIQSHMQRYGHWIEWDRFLQYLIAHARHLGDRKSEASLLVVRAYVWLQQSDRRAAIRCYRDAWLLYRELDDSRGLATTYSNLGYLYITLGHFWRAEVLNTRAVALFTRLGDTRRLAYTVNHLGIAALQQQRWEEAEIHLSRARKLMEETEDRRGLAIALHNLGNLHERTGNLEAALVYGQQAIELYRALDDRPAVAAVLMNIGNIYRRQSDHLRARDTYSQAETVLQDVGNTLDLARVRHNLGMTYTLLKEWTEAEHCFRRALEHWDLEEDPLNQANTLGELAVLYTAWGRCADAHAALDEAWALVGERHDARAQALQQELEERRRKLCQVRDVLPTTQAPPDEPE